MPYTHVDSKITNCLVCCLRSGSCVITEGSSTKNSSRWKTDDASMDVEEEDEDVASSFAAILAPPQKPQPKPHPMEPPQAPAPQPKPAPQPTSESEDLHFGTLNAKKAQAASLFALFSHLNA